MILHVDMDAFYASVEIHDRPELRNQPVIVGGTPEGRGVVAAANYEARKYGIHSAMPASRAKRLCPQAVFLPSRLNHYALVSRQIREIFHRYTPLVEPLGVATIRDLRDMSMARLQQQFGEHGRHLWELARGLDARRVVPDREAKSVSHETTFAEDITDMEALRAWAVELTEQVARRLRRHDLRGRTVQLKIRFNDFQTMTRSITLARPTNVTQEIWRAADEMLSTRVPARRTAVRLLGIGVSGFDHPALTQRMLFGEKTHETQTRLDQTADRILEKFGSASIGRASGLLHRVQHTPHPKPDDPPKDG